MEDGLFLIIIGIALYAKGLYMILEGPNTRSCCLYPDIIPVIIKNPEPEKTTLESSGSISTDLT
jgi:hypothetical protein